MAKMNDKIYINGNEIKADKISISPDGLIIDIPQKDGTTYPFYMDNFNRAVNCCAAGPNEVGKALSIVTDRLKGNYLRPSIRTPLRRRDLALTYR